MEIKVKIKKLKKENIPDVVKIHRRCVSEINSKEYSSEQISGWLAQITPENVSTQVNNSNWILALIDEKIVGFAQYSLEDGIIYQLNISPNFINQGIGRKLYDYIESEFIQNRITKISLYSTLNALNFYKKMGFNKVKIVRLQIDKEFIEEIEMIKNIKLF